MADYKASEAELETLHAAVAKVLKENLQETLTVESEEGSNEVTMVNTQVLTQAIKFLKDNNITATAEVGDDLHSVAQMLKDKPQRGRAQLRSVAAKEAAQEE